MVAVRGKLVDNSGHVMCELAAGDIIILLRGRWTIVLTMEDRGPRTHSDLAISDLSNRPCLGQALPDVQK